MENIFLNTVSVDENTKHVSTKEDIARYYFEVMNDFEDEMSDEKKQKIQAGIRAKLKAGKKLTTEEMNYLRKYEPLMYQRALRIQKMAENVENQLKHARSKQEANMIISQSVAGISDKDPDKEYIAAAINRVATKFRQSRAYAALPETPDDAYKKKKNVNRSNEQSDEESEDDLFKWTPLSEIIDSFPEFNVKA